MAAMRDRNRRRRRRGRFGFLYKLLSVVLIAAAIIAGSLVFFRVDEVVVTGNQRYTAEEVTEASGIQTGDSLVAMNIHRIATQILRQLPYVDEVSIRRGFPQTVTITVSESGAAVAIEHEGTKWLLNYRGKVLGPAEEGDETTLITGLNPLQPVAGSQLAVPREEENKLTALLSLMGALQQQGLLEQSAAFDVSLESRITFRYDERYTVVMPMSTDFEKKARALQQVVTSDQIGETGTIDFTIEEAPHYIPGD